MEKIVEKVMEIRKEEGCGTNREESKYKNFFTCSMILMMIYLCGTLCYYSQIYAMENIYSKQLISSFLSGWNYLAQSSGILLYILVYKYKAKLLERYPLIYLVILSAIPIQAIFITSAQGIFQLTMVLFSNIIIGIQTAFGFCLLAKYVDENRYGISFGIAYALGGIGTWWIFKIDKNIIRSYYLLLPYSILIVITSLFIFAFLNSKQTGVEEESELNREGTVLSSKAFYFLAGMIVLMSAIAALGSNDVVLVTNSSQLDFLTTRFFYAAGLILAGLIFDYHPILEGVCTLGALLYPLMAIVLYREVPADPLVTGLSDTFTAFFAVWRMGSFCRLHFKEYDKEYITPLGLCLSRIIEGMIILLLRSRVTDNLFTFLTTGILFVILLFLFYCFFQIWMGETIREKQVVKMQTSKEDVQVDEIGNEEENVEKQTIISKEERRVQFAQRYHLTRREEEIVEYLAEKKTNGEIAGTLNLSESTVRFHVSNILKKTGMKNRNEVARAYWALSN